MKEKLGSIKTRIVTIVIIFTLCTTLAMVSFSLYQYQAYARRNLIQSTEFNLNLVAGVIDQSLTALDNLRGWCGCDSTVTSYLSGQSNAPDAAIRAFQPLEIQTRNNQSYEYIMRIIVTNSDQTRYLQAGMGSTSGLPLTAYTVPRLLELDSIELNHWAGILTDPLSSAPALISRGPVYASSSWVSVGSSYLVVSPSIITNPLKSYQLQEGCNLYLTMGSSVFRLGDDITSVEAPKAGVPTDDDVLNPKTMLHQYTAPDGTHYLSVSCPVGSTGIWLTQDLPDSLIDGGQWLYTGQLLTICVVALLVGVVIFLLLNTIISRPIARLQDRIAAIAKGDFTPDPSIEWNDELGDIGRGVNHLSRNVQELMETRLADEKAKRDLEYQMLQSQVNPHFLYNSLNSIKWMATIQNAPGIAEMTTSLARLLKNVSKGQHSLIPLGEELSLLDDYYVIQKYRYGGAITLERHIAPGVEAALVPRFTLQPLLENAIFHGIEPKGGAGIVTVEARREGDGLFLTMADNGVGLDAETAQALLKGEVQGSSGLFRKIGLANVHHRIQYEFGPPYGLSIASEPGAYTRITVHVPFVTDRPKEEEDAKHD